MIVDTLEQQQELSFEDRKNAGRGELPLENGFTTLVPLQRGVLCKSSPAGDCPFEQYIQRTLGTSFEEVGVEFVGKLDKHATIASFRDPLLFGDLADTTSGRRRQHESLKDMVRWIATKHDLQPMQIQFRRYQVSREGKLVFLTGSGTRVPESLCNFRVSCNDLTGQDRYGKPEKATGCWAVMGDVKADEAAPKIWERLTDVGQQPLLNDDGKHTSYFSLPGEGVSLEIPSIFLVHYAYRAIEQEDLILVSEFDLVQRTWVDHLTKEKHRALSSMK